MELTIQNGLHDKTLQPISIGVENGKIVQVSEQSLPAGTRTIDALGAMISPAFIDPHFHLDNALLPEYENHSGTLREAIEIASRIKNKIDTPDIVRRSTLVLKEAILNGVLWMRSHTDIDQVAGLQLLEGVVAAREKFKEVIDIQIVAFPQLGLADNPESVDLVWQAMEAGADIVGGIPHGESDMNQAARQIEIAFEIAKAYNADIDMHVDETDDPYWHSLELLAEKTIEEGYQGRVTAGHCCAMAAWDEKLFTRILDKVIEAEINIISNVPVNLLLQGRKDRQPIRRGITRVKDLLESGVNVSCGQDDISNMFYPFGRNDMLEVANFVAHTAHLSAPALIQEAFDMPRYRAAKIMRLTDYGLEVGSSANLVLFEANSPVEALRRQPPRLYVIREGKILVESKLSRTLSPDLPFHAELV